MPQIDIERLVLNYSYHIWMGTFFLLGVAFRAYVTHYTIQNIKKFKLNLKNALRYLLRVKNRK